MREREQRNGERGGYRQIKRQIMTVRQSYMYRDTEKASEKARDR